LAHANCSTSAPEVLPITIRRQIEMNIPDLPTRVIAKAVTSSSLETGWVPTPSQAAAGVGSYQVTLSNPLAFPHLGDSQEIHWFATLEGIVRLRSDCQAGSPAMVVFRFGY